MDPADAYGLSREAPPAGWIAAAEGTPGLEEGSLSPEGPAAAVRPPRRCTAPVGGAPRSAPNRLFNLEVGVSATRQSAG